MPFQSGRPGFQGNSYFCVTRILEQDGQAACPSKAAALVVMRQGHGRASLANWVLVTTTTSDSPLHPTP